MDTTTKHKRAFQLIDPRAKFCALVLFSCSTITATNPIQQLLLSILLFAGIFAARLPPHEVFRRIRSATWFAIIIITTSVLTESGSTSFHIFGFYGTTEGLISGLLLSWKIIILILASQVFIHSTSTVELLDALENSHFPFRSTLDSAAVVLSLTISFVPMLLSSARTIKTAQIARGADVESTFLKRISYARSAALPLFANVFRSSTYLSRAMDARCFNAESMREPFSKLKMTQSDWLFLLAVAVVILSTFVFFSRY